METQTPLMATLLAVARAINIKAKEHPKEAAPYFNVAYNAVLDMCPEAAVWMWQIVKFEAKFEQHREDCAVCKPEVDCPVATKLKSKLMVYRARLAEAETKAK